MPTTAEHTRKRVSVITNTIKTAHTVNPAHIDADKSADDEIFIPDGAEVLNAEGIDHYINNFSELLELGLFADQGNTFELIAHTMSDDTMAYIIVARHLSDYVGDPREAVSDTIVLESTNTFAFVDYKAARKAFFAFQDYVLLDDM